MVAVPGGRNKNIKHRFLDPCCIYTFVALPEPLLPSVCMRWGKWFSESPPGQVSCVCVCTCVCTCMSVLRVRVGVCEDMNSEITQPTWNPHVHFLRWGDLTPPSAMLPLQTHPGGPRTRKGKGRATALCLAGRWRPTSVLGATWNMASMRATCTARALTPSVAWLPPARCACWTSTPRYCLALPFHVRQCPLPTPCSPQQPLYGS